MNIAIDVIDALGKNKNAEVNSAALLKALLALDKQNKYFLFNLYNDISLKDLLQYGDNASEYYFDTGKDFFLWNYPELIGKIYQNFILEHKIDLFFLTSSDNSAYPIDKSWFNNINLDVLNRKETAKLTLKSISCITPHTKQAQESLNNKKCKKIAFFTPLPPIESGISDYSVDIICLLSKYFSIDIFINTDYKHNCLLPQNVNVYKHTLFYIKRKKYYRLIFQMGNSLKHEYMLKYIRKYHGIVVLHDCNLHGLLNAITYGRMKYKNYEKMLSYDYENDIIDVIRAMQTGKQRSDFIVNGFVTNFADTVIVHSKWAKKQILLRNIEANVKHINLYTKIPDYSFDKSNEVKQSARKKLQIPAQDTVIAAFGFISETKRSMPSLIAIKRVITEFPGTKMIYVGQIADELKDDFFSFIQQNNLQNYVSVTGFISLETFLLYIDAADICLNLRFPYQGETSAALMRILAAGKCVIINDIGSFSEIPDECCVKILSPENMFLEEEGQIIYNAIKELINNPGKQTELGRTAREYAEKELDLNKICQQYFNVLSYQPGKKTLTNNMLSHIKSQIENKEDEDIFTLTRTLAYTMQDQDIR